MKRNFKNGQERSKNHTLRGLDDKPPPSQETDFLEVRVHVFT